jgi:dienelactone hydrolase
MCFAIASADERSAYNPLSTPSQFSPEILNVEVYDKARQCEIPIRIYLPKDKSPAPVVLFSHGLGGSRETSPYLGRHWSARGYVAVFLQHPGSDESIWKGKSAEGKKAGMQGATTGKNFMSRVKDVRATLDQLDQWNKSASHALAGRLNLDTVGMSGHSFGAVTTEALSGECFADRGPLLTDSRIDAAIIMSPSTPGRGTPAAAFGSVSLPWLLMTGTKDVAELLGGRSINDKSPEEVMKSRLAVFPALPSGDKYELILHEAGHEAFTDRKIFGKEPRNPNHHRVILAISTAFWDWYLRGDASAKDWLQGDGAKAVLEKDDSWRMK